MAIETNLQASCAANIETGMIDRRHADRHIARPSAQPTPIKSKGQIDAERRMPAKQRTYRRGKQRVGQNVLAIDGHLDATGDDLKTTGRHPLETAHGVGHVSGDPTEFDGGGGWSEPVGGMKKQGGADAFGQALDGGARGGRRDPKVRCAERIAAAA